MQLWYIYVRVTVLYKYGCQAKERESAGKIMKLMGLLVFGFILMPEVRVKCVVKS